MAKGKVTNTNPPENKGVITLDGGSDTYNYNVKAGHTVGGYVPQINDEVNFTEGSGNVATGVSKIETTNPACVMGADPVFVNKGEATVLTYSTFNATRADIQPNIGAVPVGSSQTVRVVVSVDTKYVLTVQNDEQKQAYSAVMVFVNP